MRGKIQKKLWWCLVFILASLFFVGVSCAQQYTYTVQKGDTLWDICEAVYGDPSLWPKLWEMNPFITNPHLLKPGDKIILLEDVPIKQGAKHVQKAESAPPRQIIKKKVAALLTNGIDVSTVTNINSLGYLTYVKPSFWGKIVSARTDKIILSAGDTVFVKMYIPNAEPGQILRICRSSAKLDYPDTNKTLGYIVYYLGELKLLEKLENDLFKAVILKTHREVKVGHYVGPYKELSHCVIPVPASPEIESRILAVVDRRQVIGQFTVVYIGKGYEEGVRRGNLFLVMGRRKKIESENVLLPPKILGYVLILDSHPHTATGIVILARENFSRGVRVVGASWDVGPKYLKRLPVCSK